MARKPRKQSKTGIHHIMLRGNNKQTIFQDKEDSYKFLKILSQTKEKLDFDVFAYCIMNNHVHLLIKEKENTIGQIIGSVASKFATWYNTKYERVGYLFQDRFKSEAVETNEYFLTVIRYIHQNPVKAGLCKAVSEYEFSSYNEFLSTPFLINREFVFECTTKQSFLLLHSNINDDNCLEIQENSKHRITDEKAQMIFQKLTGCKNENAFISLSKIKQQNYIQKLHDAGLSIRQISTLTGVTKRIVEKQTQGDRGRGLVTATNISD